MGPWLPTKKREALSCSCYLTVPLYYSVWVLDHQLLPGYRLTAGIKFSFSPCLSSFCAQAVHPPKMDLLCFYRSVSRTKFLIWNIAAPCPRTDRQDHDELP
ncbi:hypothetical protein N5P37_003272 [Trichoderma harzianum]|uniref:Uncharacterized protein n=1 Tax=Trichoderma harzianum CBS 226.95 TaxID=983964 RepID=A0A2T4ATW0_TRIHA|nr:hypothetical protein M431DRAFT_184262 [Trichoderma harzianum CBS 226.95]KAK0763882.1 hypothetical protein N5P37_003272 [Trichoderma harzianum]PTB60503.1 hypothetical protein M431DRAFT_184262 [Trichoderma harzianum CBS 226.95]